MKFFSMLCLLWLTIPELVAQSLEDRQDRFNDCLTGHAGLQERIRDAQSRYQEGLATTRESVSGLIQHHQVRVNQSNLEVENLRSAVELAMQLRDLDAESDSSYLQLRESILSESWASGICVEDLSFNQYQELMDNYLEDQAIRPIDYYASTYFASLLGFHSQLTIQLQAEEKWLAKQGLEWAEPHPFDGLPIEEEMYWSILGVDWSIDFRNPEPQLAQIQLIPDSNDVAAKMKFKDIVLFILNNWDNIKDILNWLDEMVFSDCSPSVTASLRSDTRDVNLMQQLSPDVDRRIYYRVGQRGVRADFRSTRTRIWGKAKLYKRKRNRFVKDRTEVVGIAYCTLQWNVCDNRPWPANGLPFVFGGIHRRGKAQISERHPYALAINNVNREFINFPLFFKRVLVDEVHLLGNGGCY